MSIARKRRKQTWQDALAQGQQQLAVWRYLLEYAGSHPLSVWTTDWPDLDRRLQRVAAAFVEEHGLHAEWGAYDSRAVRRAAPFVVDWILHLAHRIFGRPYWTWRDNRERWRRTVDHAQWRIDQERAKRARIMRDVNLAKKHHAERCANLAKDMHENGATPKEIAAHLECHLATVYRYIRE